MAKITLGKVANAANHGVSILTALATVLAVLQAVKKPKGSTEA